jgi:hypothetical protein
MEIGWFIDRNPAVGKDVDIRTSVLNAMSFEKLHVDVLGRTFVGGIDERLLFDSCSL